MRQFLTYFFTAAVLLIASKSNAQVVVTSSDSISCTNSCTHLVAHVEGDNPTNAGVTSDDVYSPSIPIGFTFSYWGINYTTCALGANGTIDFNAGDAGMADPWTISAALAGNTSKYNNICGPWCDIDIFYTLTAIGTETYSTDGVAPYRKFVVTWCGCSMYECPDQLTTTQIILYETTNVVEVHIAKKDICTSWNPSSPSGAGGRAIVGVEAPASMGGAAVVAPGRDWTPVWSALDEAWRFTPTTTAGGTASYTVASIPYAPVPYASSLVYWYNVTTGTYLGTGDSITVCPTANTLYKAGALGCADTSFGYYYVTAVSIPITVLSETNPSVCGYHDGTITLTGFLPLSTYTIHYDSTGGVAMTPEVLTSDAAGNMTITGVAAGTYSNFTATGGCPVVITGTATLTDPPPPVVTVDSALVKTCIGVPVQLDAYATPAGVTYYYSWTSPVGLSSTVVSNPIVTPTFAGDVVYTVTVNPSPGIAHCASTATVDVHAIGDFTLNNDTIICRGNTVQGNIIGSAEMNYTWSPTTYVSSPTSMTPVITPVLTAGVSDTFTYVVTGNYAHCPPYVHSFYIVVDTPAIASAIRDTICMGMVDSFNVTVPGGDYYHYLWTVAPAGGVAFSNDTLPNPIITPAAVGVYTLTANIQASVAGCGVNDFVYLDVLPNSISVSPTDTMVCKGAVVQAIGTGDPNFSYQWLPTAGIAASNVLNALIDADTTADYVVTASFHKCPDMHAYLHLDVQPNPTVYIGGNRFVCPFDTIHINAQVTPNWYPSYIYAWTPATNLDNTNTANVVFNGMTSTMLYLTVSTPAGCTSNDSAFVTVNPAPGTTIVPGMSFCPHDSAQLAPATSTPSTFQWMPPFYLSDSTGAMPWIHPITTQTYTIVATTAMGCKDTSSFTATVLPAAVIFMPDSVTIYTGDSYNIEPTTNCVSFTWFPPAGLSSTIISNPVATPEISTKYFVTGVTADGCSTIDSIAIIVEDGAIMGIPNAFTPGNGVNSLFKINLLGQAQLNYFRVFNRWGNLMYESTNINDGWDGNYKGQPQPLGVYIYEAQAVNESGKIYTKRGNITLLR